MYCILLYDIPSDKKRKKIADACLDYGLDRIQYSAFTGNISRNLQQELFQKITRILGQADGRIWLLPVGEKEWQRSYRHEKGEILL